MPCFNCDIMKLFLNKGIIIGFCISLELGVIFRKLGYLVCLIVSYCRVISFKTLDLF